MLERVNPGHTLSDDQGVDIVSAFVSFHRLEIRHVAEDWILIGNAIGAQNIS